jgi:hypothetical protein
MSQITTILIYRVLRQSGQISARLSLVAMSHTLQLKSYPGKGGTSTLLAVLGASLLPTSGLLRGLSSFMRLGTFYGRGFSLKGLWKAAMSTPGYRTAAASGALCMLVRTPNWRPRDGDVIKDTIARN